MCDVILPYAMTTDVADISEIAAAPVIGNHEASFNRFQIGSGLKSLGLSGTLRWPTSTLRCLPKSTVMQASWRMRLDWFTSTVGTTIESLTIVLSSTKSRARDGSMMIQSCYV